MSQDVDGQTLNVDTAEAIVLRETAAGDRAPARPRHRLRWGVVLFLVAAAVLTVSVLPLPYYAIAPGSARPVDPLVRVPEDRDFPPAGKVLLTTVSLRRATPLEALIGWLDADTEVVPEEVILGTAEPTELREVNAAQMDDSKQVAVVVALRRLGRPVVEQGEGTLVQRVVPGLPAEGRLASGDVIASVDGAPTPTSTQAVERIRAHQPGDKVRLEVIPAAGGPSRSLEVALAARPEGGGPVLGVELQTKGRRFDLPVPVEITSENIGGPSAGLAFTLGVIDELSPGELTGGKKVAVTGTIDLDGNVGPVGGVQQKAAAVRDAGIEVFLVPVNEADAARRSAGDRLQVVPVANLQQALDELAGRGGAPVAGAPA